MRDREDILRRALGALTGVLFLAFVVAGAMAGAAGVAVLAVDLRGSVPFATPAGAALGVAAVLWLFVDALGGRRGVALGKLLGLLAGSLCAGASATLSTWLWGRLWLAGPQGVEGVVMAVAAAALGGAALLAPERTTGRTDLAA